MHLFWLLCEKTVLRYKWCDFVIRCFSNKLTTPCNISDFSVYARNEHKIRSTHMLHPYGLHVWRMRSADGNDTTGRIRTLLILEAEHTMMHPFGKRDGRVACCLKGCYGSWPWQGSASGNNGFRWLPGSVPMTIVALLSLSSLIPDAPMQQILTWCGALRCKVILYGNCMQNIYTLCCIRIISALRRHVIRKTVCSVC